MPPTLSTPGRDPLRLRRVGGMAAGRRMGRNQSPATGAATESQHQLRSIQGRRPESRPSRFASRGPETGARARRQRGVVLRAGCDRRASAAERRAICYRGGLPAATGDELHALGAEIQQRAELLRQISYPLYETQR